MSKVIVITGAAGRIAYSLIPVLLGGTVFGPSVHLSLRLLDIPDMQQKLAGIQMEVEDSSYPLLDSVVATTDVSIAFEGADVVILLGGAPRGPGMERSEMIGINATGVAQQARDMELYAKDDVKVLVVANPANTNCLVAIHTASRIPARNFSCLTRLDHERLRGMIAYHYKERAKNLVIWGNHSQTQVPYILAASIREDGSTRSLADMEDIEVFMDSAIPRVQKRGAEIIKSLGASSAMSAAAAIGYHLADWIGQPVSSPDEIFSMGVLSNGNPYGIPPGLIYSFPCRRTASGGVEIVPELPLPAEVRALLDTSTDELLAERGEAEAIVGKIAIPDSRL